MRLPSLQSLIAGVAVVVVLGFIWFETQLPTHTEPATPPPVLVPLRHSSSPLASAPAPAAGKIPNRPFAELRQMIATNNNRTPPPPLAVPNDNRTPAARTDHDRTPPQRAPVMPSPPSLRPPVRIVMPAAVPLAATPTPPPAAPPIAAAGTTPPIRADGGLPVLITVKTTNDPPHRERVNFIAETWLTHAPRDTYFFTETIPDDITGGSASVNGSAPVELPVPNDSVGRPLRERWVTTGCPPSHSREALCCKTNSQLNFFYKQNGINASDTASAESAFAAVAAGTVVPRYVWFCHFDDDQYVIPEALLRYLASTSGSPIHTPYYIGKRSLPSGIKLRENLVVQFTTGGAGYCMSWRAMQLAYPLVRGLGFIRLCDECGAPDDVTTGFLFVTKLSLPLTESELFHSHLEHQLSVPPDEIRNHVSFGTLGSSYPVRGYTNPSRDNFANVPDLWPKAQDIMKFRALYCFLYPHSAPLCPKPGQAFLTKS